MMYPTNPTESIELAKLNAINYFIKPLLSAKFGRDWFADRVTPTYGKLSAVLICFLFPFLSFLFLVGLGHRRHRALAFGQMTRFYPMKYLFGVSSHCIHDELSPEKRGFRAI
jgi:hypothetical protein